MKTKGRVAPDIEIDLFTETFVEQLPSGKVCDATASSVALPALQGPRGYPVRIHRCLWQNVTLTGPDAQRLHLNDARVEESDLANINLLGSSLERVEVLSTRLTGAAFPEAKLKSVLFRECKLDLASFRMAQLQRCVFESCNLTEADLYATDLTGVVFRDCDLSRADLSHTNLTGADLRGCRLDGIRGKPASMEGLIISPDQAPLLITLFGVRVVW